MEALARLTAQISNLEELRDLFRAMRALAATHVQEAHAALPGIRRYVETVEDAITAAAIVPSASQPVYDTLDSVDDVLIVVCSEHGFTGAFNESVVDRGLAVQREGERLGIIGRRGAMLAKERGIPLVWSFPMATHVGGVLGVTRRVAEHLSATSGVRILFGSYQQGRNFEVEARSILPLDPALLARSERSNPPLHQIDADLLLERLAGEYLFAEITRAVMESLASENGARLAVMQGAEHNIGDRLDVLTRRSQALRQESITAELLDVVTGAEAALATTR